MSSLLDRIKQKKQAMEARTGRERPTKLKSGKNTVRILPNWDGNDSGDFSHDYGQHFIKDKAGKVVAVYVCTQNTFGKPCAVCQALAESASSTTDEATLRAIQDSKPSYRVLVNAILDKPNEPELLELPPSVFEDYLGAAETYLEQEGVNILDLKEGHNVTIEKTGSGRDTRYNLVVSIKGSSVDAAVMSKCRDLAKYVNQEYEAGLAKALSAVSSLQGANAALAATGTDGASVALSPPTAPDAELATPEKSASTTDGAGSAAGSLETVSPVIEGETESDSDEAAASMAGLDEELDAELDELINS